MRVKKNLKQVDFAFKTQNEVESKLFCRSLYKCKETLFKIVVGLFVR